MARLVLIFQNFVFNLFYTRLLGNRIQIFGFPIIRIEKGASFTCGKNVILISHPYFSEPGVNHPVVIRLLQNEAKLSLGDNVGISGGGISVEEEVTIGNNVMLGANTFITDTDFHPIDPENRRFSRDNVQRAPIVIEDNVFLGMNTVVLKGVTIGRNSIVGACSVVTRNIPSNEIWGGNPARFLKKIDWVDKS